ncbi:MAG: type II toxin-antitoxin system RelE/ParE family toxin [Flexilinea sp.]|nr:type II toxin-antitoxin system RelE/ParE family toxin [Flexilinea sp.]
MKKIILSVETFQKIDRIVEYVSAEFGSKKANEAKSLIKRRIRSLRSFPYQGESISDMYGYDTIYRKLYVPPNNIIYYVDEEKIEIVNIYNDSEDYLTKLFGSQKDF